MRMYDIYHSPQGGYYHYVGYAVFINNRELQWMQAMGADRKCLLDLETGEEVMMIEDGGYIFHASINGTMRIEKKEAGMQTGGGE